MGQKSPEILTPEARASFVNVFQPKKNRNGQERFSMMLIFPPGTDLTELRAEAKRAAMEFFGAKLDDPEFAKKLRSPFKKGEDFVGKYEGFEAGSIAIEPWSKFPPEVVYRSASGITPIVDPREFYSGCWVRCFVRAFGYDTDGNRGVAFSLGNILRTRKDKALGGRAPAEAQFANVSVPIDTSAPAAPTAAADDFLA